MMKYNLKKYLLLIFLSFLTSCSRNFEFDANASIIGTWQPVKVTVVKYVAGFEVTKSEDLTACQQQSRMIYNTDLSATELRYDDTSGVCEKTLDRKFTYTFNPTTKTLIHTFSDGSSKTAEVLSLTNTTLVVKGEKTVDGNVYMVEVTNIKINP